MKRIAVFFVAFTLAVAASAQKYDITKLVEIADVESDDQTILSVFSIPDENGQTTCFLCVGSMGLGDDIIQINVDPINKLFIPLGSNRAEVMETLELLEAGQNPTQHLVSIVALGDDGDLRSVCTQETVFRRGTTCQHIAIDDAHTLRGIVAVT